MSGAPARRERLSVGDLVEVESCDDGFEGCFCEAVISKQLKSKLMPDQRQLRMYFLRSRSHLHIGRDCLIVARKAFVSLAIPPSTRLIQSFLARSRYEVRYTRLTGARGKPILEAVCENRVRPEPPEVLGYIPKLHDFVDAFWWDGWWHGYVTYINEGKPGTNEGTVAHVRFPSARGQMLRLQVKHVRQHVRYDEPERQWLKKVPTAAATRQDSKEPLSTPESVKTAGADVPEPEHEWVKLLPSDILERRNTAKKRARARSSREVEKEANEKRQRDKAPMPDLPECPTMYPTAEEFADPYKYIAQIREQAEPYGLCKVVPPAGWAPSWPIDSENFRFQTRIQNVHQLQERGEFAFWKQLKESLARQSKPLKVVPRLNGKQIDIFTLYRRVAKMGGSAKVTADRKWGAIADELRVSKRLETRDALVHQLYKQYLQTYEQEQHARNDIDAKGGTEQESTASMDLDAAQGEAPDQSSAPAAGGSDTQCVPCAAGTASELDMKSLTGSGGENVVTGLGDDTALDQKCEICLSDDDPKSILLCDACDGGYHLYCLRPKLSVVPKGEWLCTRCRKTAQVLTDEPFGFKDGPRYTLPTFHTLSQSYKQRWYRDEVREPEVLAVERDFWEVVEGGSLAHDVQVLYGNDLPTLHYGSGFPKDEEDEYSRHPWNLNVMPTQPGSLLRHLEEVRRGEQLSGITAPWLYFGMLFSSFCWHNEDNYLYSINYMHWGEGKVWYGVPASATDQIEKAFRDSMPELFASSPDLLFHITTMLSPRILKEAGVPCYKLVQRQGEYVITW